MKIKEKFIKQKQLTDRPQVSLKNTDSTPLLSRLEKQYLFNQHNPQKTQRQFSTRGGDKENYSSMINSVPVNHEYLSHNVIKIDNYQGKRFKTQQGYQPMMTKSRYMLEKDENDQAHENLAIYKCSQNVVLRKDKIKRGQEKIYESVDLAQNQRPLTFGLVRKTEPMKTSIQYKQDIKMKNQILDQISSLRKSQQTLYGSKDYSNGGFQNIIRCINHHNKKAKYRLIAENQVRQDQQMVYCSKCAINLLQQGFKVSEMKPGMTRKMTKSQHHIIPNNIIGSVGGSSRIQQMKNFEQKLNEVQLKISQSLQESAQKTNQIEQIERQIWQTESVYEQMIGHLQKMKELQTLQLSDKKEKKILSLKKYQKQMHDELESITEMKKEMKQFRNKFMIMKQSQFQFLISSFLNKIQLYGNTFKETEVLGKRIEDQIDQIIIDLCEFCKSVKQVEESRFTQSKKWSEKNCNESEDDFICKEIKGPFRTLFPEQEINCQEKDKDNESPSFNRTQPSKMVKSTRNNQMIKNEYY